MHSYLIWTSLLSSLRSLVLFRSAFLRPIHILVQSRHDTALDIGKYVGLMICGSDTSVSDLVLET